MSTDTSCPLPADLLRFDQPLTQTAACLRTGKPLTIVAIGSSSTYGAYASDPLTRAYPPRLGIHLRNRFPDAAITVLNEGMSGEEAGPELRRFETAVFAHKPSLVVWQVGTNAAWKNQDIPGTKQAIEEGIDRIMSAGIDLIMMDLQYAPALLSADVEPRALDMIAFIADAAGSRVNVFRRFALMRHWASDGIPFSKFIASNDADQLHQNDWGYDCTARGLADAIAGAVDDTADLRT